MRNHRRPYPVFSGKIKRICSSTAAVAPQVIEDRFGYTCDTWGDFIISLNRLQAKQCQLDPVPPWLIKCFSGILTPVTATMHNASFQQSAIPPMCKHAIVRPLLKNQYSWTGMNRVHFDLSEVCPLFKDIEKAMDAISPYKQA